MLTRERVAAGPKTFTGAKSCDCSHAARATPRAGRRSVEAARLSRGKWAGAAGRKDTALGAGQGEFSFDPNSTATSRVRRNNANYASGVTHGVPSTEAVSNWARQQPVNRSQT